MMRTLGAILVIITISFSSRAQLPDGSTAPDFTLTDIDGNTHHLYEYLTSGKAVFVEFFACHCPSCWNYHNTGILESLYQTYGPDGTNQIMVLMLEHDEYNGSNEFNGLPDSYSQGDWVTGSTIPKFNVEWPNRDVFTDYNMTYYPMVYKICPDRTTELMSTSFTTEQLFQKADACPGALSINDTSAPVEIIVDQLNRQLILKNVEGVTDLNIINALGQELSGVGGLNNNIIDLTNLNGGFYILRVEHKGGTEVRKIYLDF